MAGSVIWGSVPDALPKHSLAPYVYDWCRRYLIHDGRPWEFTPGQRLFLWHYYGLDEAGGWTWKEAVYSGPKGAGKTPFAGAVCLAEFLGPVRFAGWLPDGRPRARPVDPRKALVQIAAVSQDQSANTTIQIRSMLSKRAIQRYGLKVDTKQVSFRDKSIPGKIHAVTASGASQEGNVPSFILFDEVHHWHTNEAIQVYGTMSRNALKVGTRPMATSNAHVPGLGSVMERLYDHVDGALRDGKPTSTLFMARQAPADTDLTTTAGLLKGLKEAYSDASWADIAGIAQRFMEGKESVSDFRRFFLSQVVDNGDRWVSPVDVDKAVTNVRLEPGTRVALGFDGALKHDSVALVACEIDSDRCHEVAVWERPEDAGKDYLHPSAEIDAAVRNTFEDFKVQAFFADAYLWDAYVRKWSADLMAPVVNRRGKRAVRASGSCAVAYPMGQNQRRFIESAESLQDAFAKGMVRVSGKRLARHCKNAMRQVRREGIFPAKAHKRSPDKVDGVHALSLAWEARQKVIEQGVKNRQVATAYTYEFED